MFSFSYLLTAFEETVLVDKKQQISSNIFFIYLYRVLEYVYKYHTVMSYILYSEIKIMWLIAYYYTFTYFALSL